MSNGKKSHFQGLTRLFVILFIFFSLAGVVTANMNQITCTRADSTRNKMEEIKKALLFFRMYYGRLPTEKEGLEILVKPSKDGSPILKELYRDGWDRKFIYFSDDQHYVIISYGGDGKTGGEGYKSDILVSNRKAE